MRDNDAEADKTTNAAQKLALVQLAPASTIDDLRAAKECLDIRLEIERAQAEIDTLTAPWWRKATLVATVTTILAAAVPATTAVWGHYDKEKELAIEAKKQEHQLAMERERQTEAIRTAYLDRTSNELVRSRTLRFVAATSDDPKLARWAEQEKSIVEEQIMALVRRVDNLAESIENGRQELAKRRAANDPVLTGSIETLRSRVQDGSVMYQALDEQVGSSQGVNGRSGPNRTRSAADSPPIRFNTPL